LNAIIAFSLERRVLVVVCLIFLVAAGVGAFRFLNIESYPDPVPPLLDIVTQSPGQSAEEIERYITIPIETQMAGIPHVTAIRAISLFGLSDVRLQFSYDFTYDEAEQRVVNALSQLGQLPGVGGSGAQQNAPQPQVSPWSPIGEIYRYRLVGPPNYSIMDLKTIQDWILQPRFKAVPGVIDVNGFGGKTKIYSVTVDLDKLNYYGPTLPQLIQSLNNSNLNVGAQTMNFGQQSAVVRGIALIHSMDDIRNTMLSANNGSPVRIGDVATVAVDFKPRLGIVGQDDDDEIVEGIVLMSRSAQSLPTIRAVEAEVDKINASNVLPPGVRIEKIYDRSGLINVTTSTVLHNLLIGLALIFVVQRVFLGNLRSALVVAATIPFALAFAVCIMVLRGESANLLSVGDIDFGLIVAPTVIMVENIFRHLTCGPEPARRLKPASFGADAAQRRGKLATILAAAHEVDRSIFFSASIIIAGFLPLFTLQGIEGHIFSPMAKTYAYAIAGGLIATFTVSPALAALMIDYRASEETLVIRLIRRVYSPAIGFALANRLVTLGSTAVVVILAIAAARSLGLEFLPHLEEGNLWIRATMPPSVSLEGSHDTVNRIRAVIKSFPEVETVVSEHGRPDDGTDPTNFFEAEYFAPLKSRAEWPAGVDKPKLVAEVSKALNASFPGVDFNISQYIEDNVEEAASGVKGENAVKLFGNDLLTLESTGEKIQQVLRRVPGIYDVGAYDTLGQPTVKIDIDRMGAARYGLAPGDVNATIQAAIGGQAAGNLYEEGSDRNFPIVVRLLPEQRGSLDAIRRITIGAEGGGGSGADDNSASAGGGAGGNLQAPLSEVAKISMVDGAFFIFRENRERYLPIKFSVRGRDLGGAVAEAQRRVASEVRLPGETYLKWEGEFGDLQHALDRLKFVVPAKPRADHLPGLSRVRVADRHASRGERHADGADRRRVRALRRQHAFQRLGGDRLHRALRRCGDGGNHRPHLLQSTDRRGVSSRRGCEGGLPDPAASGVDDLLRRLRRPAPRGRLDWHRRAGAEAARHRRRRRHFGRPGADPHRPAGPHRRLLAAGARACGGRSPRRSRGVGRRDRHGRTTVTLAAPSPTWAALTRPGAGSCGRVRGGRAAPGKAMKFV
jgi:cobalt-zinc-cadmium resistance protein CzcA